MTDRVEDALHRSVAQHLEILLHPCVAWTSIENRPRSRVAGAIGVARGVRAGWPDIQLMWQRGRILPHVTPILFIELKKPEIRVVSTGRSKIVQRAGKLSPDQIKCHAYLRARGFDVEVCRSIEEVMAVLARHEVPRNPKVKGTV